MDAYAEGDIDIKTGGIDVSINSMATRDGNLYVSGFDYDSDTHFIVKVEGDFKGTTNSDLKNLLQDSNFLEDVASDESARITVHENKVAKGLSDAVIEEVDTSVSKHTPTERAVQETPDHKGFKPTEMVINANNGSVVPKQLHDAVEKFTDLAKAATKATPAFIAVPLGVTLVAAGGMTPGQAAAAVIPGGNSAVSIGEGRYTEAIMSAIDDLDPTILASEGLRGFLYNTLGADVDPPMLSALKDASVSVSKLVSEQQHAVLLEAIEQGVLPSEFIDPKTGEPISAIDVFRDEEKAHAFLESFEQEGNTEAVIAINEIQECEAMRKAADSTVQMITSYESALSLDAAQNQNANAPVASPSPV